MSIHIEIDLSINCDYLTIFQSQFIEKNNDALHASLEFLIRDSDNKLLKQMFEAVQISTGKLNFISVGSKFRQQLSVLMEKLRATVSLSEIDIDIHKEGVKGEAAHSYKNLAVFLS